MFIGSMKLGIASSGFCVKFSLANWHHHNWQSTHQNVTLKVPMEPIGQFG